MITLILLLVIGSALVYVSKFNFVPVTLNLGMYVFSNVPLFYVIIGSLLIGLVLSYLINMVGVISSSFTLRGKNNELKKDKDEILELTKRVHQLELEKEKIIQHSGNEPKDQNAL